MNAIRQPRRRSKPACAWTTAKACTAAASAGPALVPGNADKSVLMQALRHDELQMPPERKLPAEVIEQFARWIELGAADPREEPAAAPTAAAKTIDWTEARSFWAFQPPAAAALPVVQQPQWPRRRHDYFVLARMEQAGLTPESTGIPRRVAAPHQL